MQKMPPLNHWSVKEIKSGLVNLTQAASYRTKGKRRRMSKSDLK